MSEKVDVIAVLTAYAAQHGNPDDFDAAIADVAGLHSRAVAWNAVFDVLCEVSPGWHDNEMTGVEAATKAIRDLAALRAVSGSAVTHCQNGRADVCRASQRDGVICPDDSCDIDDGIREPDPAPAAVSGSVAEIRECGEIAWQQGGPCQLAPGTKLYAQPVSGSVGGEVEALRIAAKRLRRLALECPLGSAIRDDACEWAAEADAAIIASAPTAAPQVDEMPGADVTIFERDCTDEAARKFYAKGWNECRAAMLAAAPTPAQSEPPAEGG